jgi:hypothetical protein
MRPTVIVCAVLVEIMASSAAAIAAPRQGGMGAAPRYDTATEVTLHGTVLEVTQVAGGMGGRSLGRTHIVLKTGEETVEVHLGPTWFLADQKLELKSEDVVDVIGSRVTTAGAQAIIAREVRTGGQVTTLRDAQGFPKWLRGARR